MLAEDNRRSCCLQTTGFLYFTLICEAENFPKDILTGDSTVSFHKQATCSLSPQIATEETLPRSLSGERESKFSAALNYFVHIKINYPKQPNFSLLRVSNNI